MASLWVFLLFLACLPSDWSEKMRPWRFSAVGHERKSYLGTSSYAKQQLNLSVILSTFSDGIEKYLRIWTISEKVVIMGGGLSAKFWVGVYRPQFQNVAVD